MLTVFKDYFISIGPFIDNPKLFHKFQPFSFTQLPTKYQNKTNVLPNITVLVFSSNPNLLEIFHP